MLRRDRRDRAGARRTLGVVVLIALGLLSGCTSEGGPAEGGQGPQGEQRGTAGQSRAETPAAEPGKAPKPGAAPEGRIIQLPGGAPEGAVLDASTGTLAVALREPGRLALVNTDTGAVRTVPALGAARHLSLAGPGELLVSGESADTLSRVRLPGGEVISKTDVGRGPHDAARVGNRVFVSNEFGSSVGVVQGGRMIREIGGVSQPGGLTATDGRVAVVDVRGNSLHIIDARTLRQVAELPAGEGPSHVRPIGDGQVAVADTRGNAVLTYQVTGAPRKLDRVPVPGRAYGLDADPGRGSVYATSGNNNRVFRLRVADDGTLGEPAQLATVRQPNDVAVDPRSGRIYIIGQDRARVQVLEPSAFDR